jgi:hypothetical protein
MFLLWPLGPSNDFDFPSVYHNFTLTCQTCLERSAPTARKGTDKLSKYHPPTPRGHPSSHHVFNSLPARAGLPRRPTRHHLHQTIPATFDRARRLPPYAPTSRQNDRHGNALHAHTLRRKRPRNMGEARQREHTGARQGRVHPGAFAHHVRAAG